MLIPIEKRALDILKEYKGSNDHILNLQKRYFKSKSFIPTRNQSDYIVRFHNIAPVLVNKTINIHKSCRKFVQTQLKLDFEPDKIYINKLLSRRDDMLDIWGCFDNDCKSYQQIYISKECLKKTKEISEIDFSKYERDPKPHQIVAIKKLLENEKYILADDMGLGKALEINTLCYTPNGKVRIGSLKTSDKVIGSDGKPYNVIGIFPQGNLDLYQITFNDGYSIKCCGNHLWNVASTNSGNNKDAKYFTLSTNQLLDRELILGEYSSNYNKKYKYSTYYKKPNGKPKWQIPFVKPIEFKNIDELSINPYLVGLGLSDGDFNETNIRFQGYKDGFDESIGNKLLGLGLSDKDSDTKFIPNIYKYTSIENRLAILQGLMDTDGRCMISKNSNFAGIEYATISEQLADDVAEIVQSLGGIVRKKSKIGPYKKPNGTKVICKKYYSLNIKLPEGMNPFRLKIKADMYDASKKHQISRRIKDIQPCGDGEAVCISVDSPDKLYVIEHAIVTHNTTSAIIAAMEGGFKKILVICPASLKINWQKEIMNYDSEKNISIVDSVDFKANKWTIVNYDILKNFHHLPERGVKISDLPTSPIDFHKFDLVIADEAHYLKTATSNRTKIFNDFASRIPNRWFLTGTPITNRPIDFYNLLHMCESPIATNWVHYVRRYCAGKQFNRKGTKQKYWVTSGASNLDELRDYSADVMLRRTKKDSIDLPQKTIKPVYLPLEYSTSYNAYIAEYEQWVEEMAAMGEKPSITDHLTKLIKVRQLLSNDKIEPTIKLAEDLIENEHKVIIFSCFTQTINAIHEHFGKASVLIDGSVSKEKRQLAVDRFQNDSKVKVFCGNIVAAGVGLTLTEGTIVIFNDLDWTPANHAQAEDRVHRIGQQNDVHIIYPLFDNTLDTIMFKTLRKKMKIINHIMGDDMTDANLSMGSEVINSFKR